MNINKTETDFLLKQKVYGEKKSWNTAIEEVTRDKDYESQLTKNIRQKEKDIKLAENKLNTIQNKFEREFKKLKDIEDRNTKPITTNGHNATTLQIRRIIHILDDNPSLSPESLVRETGFSKEIVKDSLHCIEIIKKRK